jgi:ABC-type transport system substrate-binding protein
MNRIIEELRRLRRRATRLHLVTIGTAVAVLMVTFVGTVAQTVPSAGASTSSNTLTVAETDAPVTLDPQASPLTQNYYAWDLSYQCLLTTTNSGAVQPMLATKYTVSPNGLTYTFFLRKGVVFQNGAPFTSADVVYTFHRLMTSGTPAARSLYPGLAANGTTAEGAYEVKFTLKNRDAGFLDNMANPLVFGCAILSKSSTHLAQKMNGTGPWQQVSYSPNDELVVKRFTKYWGPKTGTENLDVLYIPTASTQVTDLQSGKVNLIFPSASGVESLKGDSSVSLNKVASATSVLLDSNSTEGPMKNLDVRRAVALAINREQLAKVAYQGLAVPSGYVVPSYSWAAPLSSLPYWSQNISKAKKLLAEGGYPHGFTTNLIYIPGYDQGTNALVQLLALQLAKIGVTLKLVPLQVAAWVQADNTDYNFTLSWNEESYYSDPGQYVAVEGYVKAPIPAPLKKLFAAEADASSTTQYEADINKIQKEEAYYVYPTTTLIAEYAYVAYSKSLSNVNVGVSLSRNFLAAVKIH